MNRTFVMPQIIETTVYQFHELQTAAQERARDWYRQSGLHDDWWDAVFDDFQQVCALLGVEIKIRPLRLMGGGMSAQPCIWFSGFASQGDGACFEGRYRYRPGASVEIRSHFPTDTDLHAIADGLQASQKPNFYQLEAQIAHRGSYYHAHSLDIEIERPVANWQPPAEGTSETLIEALRDLARWLNQSLEAEHDHLNSDEAVDETLIANDYSFTDSGRRFG